MCHALVEGKQILDASFIANKAIDSRLKSNLPEVICNLDKEKAYDYFNWGFLLAIVEKMGFR